MIAWWNGLSQNWHVWLWLLLMLTVWNFVGWGQAVKKALQGIHQELKTKNAQDRAR